MKLKNNLVSRSKFSSVKIIYVIILQFIGYQITAQDCQVKGYIKGLGDKVITINYQHNGINQLDSVTAANDHFIYIAKRSDDNQLRLRINQERSILFWRESGTVTITGSVDNPYRLAITGTFENNTINQYRRTIEWKYEDRKKNKAASIITSLNKREQEETLQFIKANPYSRTSAYLLYGQSLQYDAKASTYEIFFRRLSPYVKRSFQGKQVGKRISILRNQPIVGKKSPAFSIPDTSGKIISLVSYKGKYIVLDFWGHWCSPCLKSFPKLKRLNEQYGKKIILIGIAAESTDDKGIWKRTIKDNNLDWLQVSELKSDGGDVNEQYNIMAYPTYILIDKQGIVLERAKDLEAIERRLKLLNDF